MADTLSITSRRTVLAGIAVTSVISIKGEASAPDTVVSADLLRTAPIPSGPTLLALWHERCRWEDMAQQFDEHTHEAQYEACHDRRMAIEDLITMGEVRCLDDLRGKIELMRFYSDPTGPGADDNLDASIVAGFDRLFARG